MNSWNELRAGRVCWEHGCLVCERSRVNRAHTWSRLGKCRCSSATNKRPPTKIAQTQGYQRDSHTPNPPRVTTRNHTLSINHPHDIIFSSDSVSPPRSHHTEPLSMTPPTAFHLSPSVAPSYSYRILGAITSQERRISRPNRTSL